MFYFGYKNEDRGLINLLLEKSNILNHQNIDGYTVLQLLF